ncbi:hypothetical protein HPB48_019198 [Haemaphysalis longicornis]|uniref:Uncharacterized protein n=1 Tax=Haemaphysalis longicornis TaxID=44386 RepID=A0A9J6GRK5_HAELO|nr:hypothetical protein HPB48_019198 [Haemaphysalis longicornis]
MPLVEKELGARVAGHQEGSKPRFAVRVRGPSFREWRALRLCCGLSPTASSKNSPPVGLSRAPQAGFSKGSGELPGAPRSRCARTLRYRRRRLQISAAISTVHLALPAAQPTNLGAAEREEEMCGNSRHQAEPSSTSRRLDQALTCLLLPAGQDDALAEGAVPHPPTPPPLLLTPWGLTREKGAMEGGGAVSWRLV